MVRREPIAEPHGDRMPTTRIKQVSEVRILR